MKTTLEDVVQPGAVVGGYRIEKKLGAGGFGRVYLAWRDGGPCALKFIHLESVGGWGWRELYFTLKSWDENGGRPVTLGGVTFP